MSNGLSNHDPGRPSDGGKNQPPPALFDDENDDEAIDTDDEPNNNELLDTAAGSAPELSMTEALKAEAKLISAPHTKHYYKRLIEARWEEKRLDALIREVYEEMCDDE